MIAFQDFTGLVKKPAFHLLSRHFWSYVLNTAQIMHEESTDRLDRLRVVLSAMAVGRYCVRKRAKISQIKKACEEVLLSSGCIRKSCAMVRLHGISVVYTENARLSVPGILDFSPPLRRLEQEMVQLACCWCPRAKHLRTACVSLWILPGWADF